jgi:hypothetical protein
MWWRRIRYVLVLVALCSIATCPSAHRSCRATVRAREAEALLEVLTAELTRLAATTGLPTTAAGPTPAVASCCEQGGQCAPNPALWQGEPWRALRFSLDAPARYAVQYAPTRNGAVVRVLGDLDCDGVLASYELRASVLGRRVTFQRSTHLPLE